MPAWNDTHYARAQEFTQLLAVALAAAPSPAAPAAVPAPADPAPVAAAEPTPAVAPAAPPAAPATGANLFKKIPWKK